MSEVIIPTELCLVTDRSRVLHPFPEKCCFDNHHVKSSLCDYLSNSTWKRSRNICILISLLFLLSQLPVRHLCSCQRQNSIPMETSTSWCASSTDYSSVLLMTFRLLPFLAIVIVSVINIIVQITLEQTYLLYSRFFFQMSHLVLKSFDFPLSACKLRLKQGLICYFQFLSFHCLKSFGFCLLFDLFVCFETFS